MFASKVAMSTRTRAATSMARRTVAPRATQGTEGPDSKEFNPDDVPQSTSQGGTRDITAVKLDVPAEPVQSVILGRTQELINGRAAMLGLIAAAGSEFLSGQGVLSQVTGKYVDGEMVERAHGMSTLYFGAIVVVITLASLAPKLFENQQPEDRQYGPWKASAEVINGRVAMMGFAALLLTEKFLTGGSPVF